MIFFSPKVATLAFVIAFSSFISGSAHAAILRSSNGMPVLTKDGNCVITGWQGSEDCEAAKTAAGLDGNAATAATEQAHDKTVYFDFNKSSLTPDAKHKLNKLAKKLHWVRRHKTGSQSITVIGYADRIGNASYNQKLALRRAERVRSYLISKGVKAKINVRSLGKTEPKAECSADLTHTKLIACLREDRRVDIEFTTNK